MEFRHVACASLALTAAWGARHARSPAVRRWAHSPVPTIRAGGLNVRVVGEGSRATILLHGLAGCGDYYGSRYDALASDRRVVVPDLLGYGDSYLTRAPAGFGLRGQLEALDEMAEALGLTGPMTIVGHSMGASLALHWAARRGVQVERVLAFSAPLFVSAEEGRVHVRALGPIERIMARDNNLSQATCDWMCRHRTTASWLAAALSPQLPLPLARRGILHTWPAYQASMNDIVLDSGWQQALVALASQGVPVVFANGDRDPIPVHGRTTGLASQHPSMTALSRPHVGHDLPLADPQWCAQLCEVPVTGFSPVSGSRSMGTSPDTYPW